MNNYIANVSNCKYVTWSSFTSEFKSDFLSVLCLNSRSILNKFGELKCYLESLTEKFSFIIITESWLRKNTDFCLDLPDYGSVSVYRDYAVGVVLRFTTLKVFLFQWLKLLVTVKQESKA